jgi:hypothetical protein
MLGLLFQSTWYTPVAHLLLCLLQNYSEEKQLEIPILDSHRHQCAFLGQLVGRDQ